MEKGLFQAVVFFLRTHLPASLLKKAGALQHIVDLLAWEIFAFMTSAHPMRLGTCHQLVGTWFISRTSSTAHGVMRNHRIPPAHSIPQFGHRS